MASRKKDPKQLNIDSQPIEFKLPTPGALARWEDECWGLLSTDLRERSVDQVIIKYGDEWLKRIGKLIDDKGLSRWVPVFWHFGEGQAVRNCIREVVKDNELPKVFGTWTGVKYPKPMQSTWDEFYLQVIEAAAGRRNT